jgi:hypothetical protein
MERRKKVATLLGVIFETATVGRRNCRHTRHPYSPDGHAKVFRFDVDGYTFGLESAEPFDNRATAKSETVIRDSIFISVCAPNPCSCQGEPQRWKPLGVPVPLLASASSSRGCLAGALLPFSMRRTWPHEPGIEAVRGYACA